MDRHANVAGSFLIAVAATAAVANLPSNLKLGREVNAGGDVPPRAVPGGTEAHGEVLYGNRCSAMPTTADSALSYGPPSGIDLPSGIISISPSRRYHFPFSR